MGCRDVQGTIQVDGSHLGHMTGPVLRTFRAFLNYTKTVDPEIIERQKLAKLRSMLECPRQITEWIPLLHIHLIGRGELEHDWLSSPAMA